MRWLCLVCLLAYAAISSAQQPRSPREAWTYLSQPGKSERWVIISSTRNDGYFQCENLDSFVLCPVPVWVRHLPTDRRHSLTNPIATPHADIPGSRERRFLTDAQAAAAKRAMRRMKLAPDDVYSQMRDERRRIIGTAYDIRIALDFNFKEFEKLVDAYMLAVWNTSSKDGYRYETD